MQLVNGDINDKISFEGELYKNYTIITIKRRIIKINIEYLIKEVMYMYKKILTLVLAFTILAAFMITPKIVSATTIVGDGRLSGYVSGDYLKQVSRPDRSGIAQCVVNLNDTVNGYLNVRNAPNGKIVAKLHHGDRVTCYIEYSSGSWSYIRY